MGSTEFPSALAKPLAGHRSQGNCALLGIRAIVAGWRGGAYDQVRRPRVHYRDLAAKCRDKGDKIPDSQARAVLFEVAATWERLAALEQQNVEQHDPGQKNRHEGRLHPVVGH